METASVSIACSGDLPCCTSTVATMLSFKETVFLDVVGVVDEAGRVASAGICVRGAKDTPDLTTSSSCGEILAESDVGEGYLFPDASPAPCLGADEAAGVESLFKRDGYVC